MNNKHLPYRYAAVDSLWRENCRTRDRERLEALVREGGQSIAVSMLLIALVELESLLLIALVELESFGAAILLFCLTLLAISFLGKD